MTKLLGFIKPDAVFRENIGRRAAQRLLSETPIKVLSFQKIQITKDLLDKHYSHVTTRAFYPWLVQYITAGPSYVMIVETDDGGIAKIRDLLGSTLSHKAEPGTVRAESGVYGGINCLHISDSPESAENELSLWRREVRIEEGKFDQQVEQYISSVHPELANNTMDMRAICATAAARGQMQQSERDQLRSLLAQETKNLDAGFLSAIAKAIEDSCFF